MVTEWSRWYDMPNPRSVDIGAFKARYAIVADEDLEIKTFDGCVWQLRVKLTIVRPDDFPIWDRVTTVYKTVEDYALEAAALIRPAATLREQEAIAEKLRRMIGALPAEVKEVIPAGE